MNMLVEVEVSKEAYELGQGLSKFHRAVKEALANGWQSDQDMSPIIQSALADLVPAMQGADQSLTEAQTDTQAFANSVYLGISDITFQYIKKPAAPTAPTPT